MEQKDQIYEDAILFYSVFKTYRRLIRKGAMIDQFVTDSYNELLIKLSNLYVATGINFITYSDEDLVAELLSDECGYLAVAHIPGRNICAIKRMAFTVGVFYDINYNCTGPRYCYHTMAEAKEAFNTWDGNGHPPGNWVKHKGRIVEESNPNYTERTNYAS